MKKIKIKGQKKARRIKTFMYPMRITYDTKEELDGADLDNLQSFVEDFALPNFRKVLNAQGYRLFGKPRVVTSNRKDPLKGNKCWLAVEAYYVGKRKAKELGHTLKINECRQIS